MRVAVTAVAAAFVGTAGVLLVLAPAAPPPAAAPVEPALEIRGESCPPCRMAPLGPVGWKAAIDEEGGEESLSRASALSLSMEQPQVVQLALDAEDPALRELAALLLNVASGRVAGCTRLGGGGNVAAVLDRLDQLVARVRDGEKVEAAELASAAAAAAVLNRGEGLPEQCNRR